MTILRISIVISIAIQILCAPIPNQPRLPVVVAVHEVEAGRGSADQWGQCAEAGAGTSQDAARLDRGPNTVCFATQHEIVDGKTHWIFNPLAISNLNSIDVRLSVSI
jgi:hypothetical protein